jgi:DNA (cytosine-5)-methyltransferase 1
MQFKGKHIDPYESFYWNTTQEFFRGQLGGGISRTVKTDDSLAVMEEVKIGAMRGRNPDNPSERGRSNGNYQQRLEINENGMSNTLTSVQKDNLVIEPTEDTDTTICLNSKVDGKQPSLEHRIYDSSGNSTAITTGFHPSVATPKYRIRKLTPRECFRLMGCDEETIDIIQAAGISNSQQYKLAGNSIVVDVLYHLFRKMFVETENESQQLTLF